MDTTSLIFQTWYKMRYVKLPLSIIFIFIFLSFSKLVLAQTSMTNCTLNLQIPSLRISSGCEGGNWGGFLPKNCCGVALERYLYALGKRANQTGQIYLNATEQMRCLDLMRNYDEDVFGCGIERLTSGAGGCSDFMVKDAVNKLRKGFQSLGDDCKLLGNEGGLDFKCSDCLRSWIELGKSYFNEREPVQVDADICRFAVLVSLMSEKIDDVKLVDAVYRCLGESDYNGADQGIKPKRSNISPGLIVLIAGLIGMALVVFFVLWQFFKRRFIPNGSQGQDLIELLPELPGCQKIPIKEIYAATDDLNVVNFIGQGIAGKVYKGILPSGRHVAVKHIIKDGYVETFVREVTSLSHVRHPNLVALLGYCEEEEECFLVYELCSNGNLSEWLFGKDKYLSWIQRLEIAIDGARGLWFLHTYPEGCIVHRDIKPTNILLGDHFEAKLSDFGLSKIMELGQSYVSSEVRGTFGYVDPEYQKNHRVNPAGDVYSFGIVLLQILSGKRVINLNVKKPMALDKMAKLLFRGGNMLEFADPKLNGEYSMEAFDLVLKLALSCTAHKQQRPSMEQVVTRLEEALDISTSADATLRPLLLSLTA